MRLIVGTEDGVHAARWIRGERSARVVSSGLEGREVDALVAPGSRVFLAAEGAGIFASADRGGGWERRSSPPGERAVRALCTLAPGGDLLYAGTEPAALYASRDGGASWTRQRGFDAVREDGQWQGYGEREARVRTLAADPHGERDLYAGVEIGGAYRTDDGGRSWREAGAGLYDDVHVLAPDPAAAGRLYAATGGGLYLTDDRGGEWRAHPGNVGSRYCTDLCIAEHPEGESSRLFLATAGGPPGTWGRDDGAADAKVHESEDGGETWREHSARPLYPDREGFSALTPEPERFGGVFAGTTEGAVHYGDPEMEGWSRILSGLPAVRALAAV